MPVFDKVYYPKTCSALCREKVTKQERDMAVRFFDRLETFRKALCAPGSFHEHDVVLALELYFRLNCAPRVVFVAFPQTYGRRAQFPASYSFILLDASGDVTIGEYVGLELWLAFSEYIKTRCLI